MRASCARVRTQRRAQVGKREAAASERERAVQLKQAKRDADLARREEALRELEARLQVRAAFARVRRGGRFWKSRERFCAALRVPLCRPARASALRGCLQTVPGQVAELEARERAVQAREREAEETQAATKLAQQSLELTRKEAARCGLHGHMAPRAWARVGTREGGGRSGPRREAARCPLWAVLCVRRPAAPLP